MLYVCYIILSYFRIECVIDSWQEMEEPEAEAGYPGGGL